jgi:predicted transcriptional regulator
MSRAIVRYSPDAAKASQEEDAAMLQRLAALERGEPVAEADAIFYFGSFDMLAALLAPKRRALLERVMHQPMPSVRALSTALGRDYKNVHEDVTRFEQHGLIERAADGSVFVPFDEIRIEAELTLVRAA